VLPVHHVDSLPEVLLLLVGGQVVEPDVVPQLWVVSKKFERVFPQLFLGCTAAEVGSKLYLVERNLGSLIKKV
jgi:hypothetical protein